MYIYNFIIIRSLIDAKKKKRLKTWGLVFRIAELPINKKSQNKKKPTTDGNKLRKFQKEKRCLNENNIFLAGWTQALGEFVNLLAVAVASSVH